MYSSAPNSSANRTASPAQAANGTGTVRPRSDLALILSGAANGDAEAWNEITDRFTNLLWSVARSHRLNDADSADVVQNTWLRLLENLNRINNPAALPGWLATTARREAISLLRRRHREFLPPTDTSYFNRVETDAREIDGALLDQERDRHLWSCFLRLEQRDQQLLRALIAGDRPSYVGIAAALDMPVGSIGPTRMRALSRLHDIVAESTYPFQEPTTPVVTARQPRPANRFGTAD